MRSVEIGLVIGIEIEIEVGTAAETEIGTEEIETTEEIAMLIQAEIEGIETIEIETEIVGGIVIAMVEVLVGTIAGGKEIVVMIEATIPVGNLLVRNLLKLIGRSSVNKGRSTT